MAKLCGNNPDITATPEITYTERSETRDHEFLDGNGVLQCTTWTQSLCIDATRAAQGIFVESVFNLSFNALASLAPGGAAVKLLSAGITSHASSTISAEIERVFNANNETVVYSNGGSMHEPEPCFQGERMPEPVFHRWELTGSSALKIYWSGYSLAYEIKVDGMLLGSDEAKRRYDWDSVPNYFPGTFLYIHAVNEDQPTHETFSVRTLDRFRKFGERDVRPPSEWVDFPIWEDGDTDICPYTPEPGGSEASAGPRQTCPLPPGPTTTPTVTPTQPPRLPKPTGLRLVGSRTLCWLYHADGHQQGFRVWREPVPDFIRSAQAASDPVTVTDFCHTFPVVHPRDTLYVRALGDGVRYLNSEAGHLYVGCAIWTARSAAPWQCSPLRSPRRRPQPRRRRRKILCCHSWRSLVD